MWNEEWSIVRTKKSPWKPFRSWVWMLTATLDVLFTLCKYLYIPWVFKLLSTHPWTVNLQTYANQIQQTFVNGVWNFLIIISTYKTARQRWWQAALYQEPLLKSPVSLHLNSSKSANWNVSWPSGRVERSLIGQSIISIFKQLSKAGQWAGHVPEKPTSLGGSTVHHRVYETFKATSKLSLKIDDEHSGNQKPLP